MTFSIVAADREAKAVGFAIASCCWDAGQVCMARAEKGAIASQASGNVTFLPRFFDELAAGKAPEAILALFRSIDTEIESRQIGMMPYDGRPLAFTGARCTPWAGHHIGSTYACQGNTLVGAQVIDEMITTFDGTEGPLHRRLFAALSAGDAAGGDIRGRQSARLVVRKKGWGHPDEDTLLDFTLEDHDDPVTELGRLLDVIEDQYAIWGKFRALAEAAPEQKPAILDDVRALLHDRRDRRDLDGWESLGTAYYELGDTDAAVDAFTVYLSINPAMRSVLEAGIQRGTFPADLAARLFS
ncbi:MAG: DUF1028 domain-containing protein [Candidatus Bipolaricaulota bacterium]